MPASGASASEPVCAAWPSGMAASARSGGSLEFVTDRESREPAGELMHRVEQMAFAKGLLVLAAGKNALRLAPPLVIDDEDVDLALAILAGTSMATTPAGAASSMDRSRKATAMSGLFP